MFSLPKSYDGNQKTGRSAHVMAPSAGRKRNCFLEVKTFEKPMKPKDWTKCSRHGSLSWSKKKLLFGSENIWKSYDWNQTTGRSAHVMAPSAGLKRNCFLEVKTFEKPMKPKDWTKCSRHGSLSWSKKKLLFGSENIWKSYDGNQKTGRSAHVMAPSAGRKRNCFLEVKTFEKPMKPKDWTKCSRHGSLSWSKKKLLFGSENIWKSYDGNQTTGRSAHVMAPSAGLKRNCFLEVKTFEKATTETKRLDEVLTSWLPQLV